MVMSHLGAMESTDARNFEALNEIFRVNFHYSLAKSAAPGIVYQHVNRTKISRSCGKRLFNRCLAIDIAHTQRITRTCRKYCAKCSANNLVCRVTWIELEDCGNFLQG